MPVQSAGNSLYFGDQFMSLKDYGLGILGGALTGGIGNGTVAALKGNNFWTGKEVKFGRTIFSFKNTATKSAPKMEMLDGSKSSLGVKQPNVAKETLSFPERTMENFKEHFNLGGRHADLNLSTEKIVSNVKGFVIDNQQVLQQGDNTFIGQINGFDKSIKVYLYGTTVRSMNMYPGVSNRISVRPPIKYGNLKW